MRSWSSVLVPWFAASLFTSSLAAAEPPPAAPNVPTPGAGAPPPTSGEPPQRWQLPPCAPVDADEEIRMSTGCSGVFGLRGSVTDVRGVSAGSGAGLMVSGEGEEFVRRGLFNAHGSHRLALGGGGAGFEGTLQGAFAGGFRVPIGERHGPVLRAGAVGYLRGNDAFYASLVELPQVQLGYQYLRGIAVIELAATSGVVFTGRERVGGAQPRILANGLEVGAYAAVQMRWLRMSARVMRLPTDDALASEVGVVEGTLCGVAAPLAICADGRGVRTDAITDATGAPTAVRSLYAGLTIGFTRER